MRSDILTIYNQYGFLAKANLDGFISTLDDCVTNDEKVTFIAPGKHDSKGIWSITNERIIFIGVNHIPVSFPFSQIQKVERKKPFFGNFKLFFWFNGSEIDMKIDDNKNLMAAFDIVSENCEKQAEIINKHKTGNEKYQDYIQEQEQNTKDELLHFAKDYLDTDEKEIMSIKGYYEAKFLGFDSALDGILIATNKRLFFCGYKTIGIHTESFSYKNISSFEMGEGLTGYTITFYAMENKISMKYIQDKRIKEFVQEVRQRIENSSTPTFSITNIDAADQIKKFAELRDAGILTEEEFQAKKKQLLGI